MLAAVKCDFNWKVNSTQSDETESCWQVDQADSNLIECGQMSSNFGADKCQMQSLEGVCAQMWISWSLVPSEVYCWQT